MPCTLPWTNWRAQRHFVVTDRKKDMNGCALLESDLSRPPAVADVLSTYEVLSAFIGSSADLMTFLSGYGFSRPVTEEERLTLFCRIASEFPEDLRIGPDLAESANYCYPLIYAR